MISMKSAHCFMQYLNALHRQCGILLLSNMKGVKKNDKSAATVTFSNKESLCYWRP